MNETQRYLAVGATLIAAIAGLVVALAYLRGTIAEAQTTDYRVLFDDARGIQTGYQVRLAGIPIGKVQDVTLVDRQAQMRLRIDDKFPLPADSRFQVVTPLIGSTPFVQVVPGVSSARLGAATVVRGERTAGVDTLMGRADSVMGKVDGLLGDPALQADLRATIHNLRLASEELPRTLERTQAIIGNAATLSQQTTRLVPNLERQIGSLTDQTGVLLREFQKAARTGTGVATEAKSLTADLRATVNENRAGIKALLRNTNDAVSGVAALTGQIGETLGSSKFREKFDAATGNLETVTRNIVTISERLDATAAEVQRFASDPALLGDVKATVANLKETSASVKGLAERLATVRIPGERRPGATVPPNTPVRALPALAEPGLTFDSRYDTTAERLRNDVHFVVPSGLAGEYWRVGLFGMTEANRLDLQAGRTDGRGALRYGLFSGRLGAGLDTPVLGWDLRLDVYDPNRFTVDARLRKRLDSGTSLLFGVDKLGNGNAPVVGVQFKR
ncbi:MAG: MlaD family protein [Armatimonadota bacterium]